MNTCEKYEERAAIIEHCGCIDKDSAEHEARRQCCIGCTGCKQETKELFK